MRNWKPLLGLVLLTLLLVGCRPGGIYEGLPKQLVKQTLVYEDIMRWRDLRKIYLFGKPGEKAEVQQGLENIRVNGYDAGKLTEITPWRWGQAVMISYVLVDRQVVKTVLDQQVWVSEDKGKTWYRESPAPRF